MPKYSFSWDSVTLACFNIFLFSENKSFRCSSCCQVKFSETERSGQKTGKGISMLRIFNSCHSFRHPDESSVKNWNSINTGLHAKLQQRKLFGWIWSFLGHTIYWPWSSEVTGNVGSSLTLEVRSWTDCTLEVRSFFSFSWPARWKYGTLEVRSSWWTQ